MACVSLFACAAEAPPVATAVIEPPAPSPGTDPLTPSERLLALLTADNPGLERVAMSLAALGDEPALREAGVRLVRLARAERGKREHEAILAAMSHVKGTAVQAYCFALAEDDAGPWDRRRLALRVLSLVVDDGDAAGTERRARAAARLPPPSPATTPASIVAFLHPAARACYRRVLDQDQAIQGTARVTLRFSQEGAVESSIEGTMPDDFKRCLLHATSQLRVTEGHQLGPVLAVSFSFVPQ
jgi:hypothetical protein